MNAEQQRLMANQRKKEAEIQTAMDTTMYPAGLVPDWFKMVLLKALDHESQRTLGCNWEQLKSIRNGEPEKFTMTQMGHALNSIESKTPEQLYFCPTNVLKVPNNLTETEVEVLKKDILGLSGQCRKHEMSLTSTYEFEFEYIMTYDQIQEKVFEMATKWNEIMLPIKEAIAKKYDNKSPLFIPHKNNKRK